MRITPEELRKLTAPRHTHLKRLARFVAGGAVVFMAVVLYFVLSAMTPL